VRVHADTDNAPFDVNEGMKLELGSTGKTTNAGSLPRRHCTNSMTSCRPLDTGARELRDTQAPTPSPLGCTNTGCRPRP